MSRLGQWRARLDRAPLLPFLLKRLLLQASAWAATSALCFSDRLWRRYRFGWGGGPDVLALLGAVSLLLDGREELYVLNNRRESGIFERA